MTEFTGKIDRIFAEKGDLLVLMKRGDKYSLKIYQLSSLRETEFINEIFDLNSDFVTALQVNYKITSNVVVHND